MPAYRGPFASRLLLALGSGLFCAVLAWFELVLPLDRLIYDAANESTALPVADDVLIVAVDERSLLELGRWPWPRERHVELLRRLDQAGVQAIAMDVIFAEPDADYPEVDTLLAAAIKRHGGVVLPVFMGQAYQGGQLFEVEPIPPLREAAAALGHVHVEVDDDGIARKVFLKEGLGSPHWPHFSVALQQLLTDKPVSLPGISDPSAFSQPAAIAIIRSHRNLIPFMGTAGSVESVSYTDVLAGRIPARELRDRIILVGATAAGLGDQITTSLGQMSGIELNANIFQALRLQQLITPVIPVWQTMISFLLTSAVVWVFTGLPPRRLLPAFALTLLLIPLASVIVLARARLWFAPTPIIVALLVVYPIWNWLRLQALMQFMHRQLSLLKSEQAPLYRPYSVEELEAGLSFLYALGDLRGWTMSGAVGGAIQGEGRCTSTGHSQATTGIWEHDGTISHCSFDLDGTRYQASLEWRQQVPAHHSRLETIFPSEHRRPGDGRAGGDLVQRTIVELAAAYQMARDNRTLVRDSIAQMPVGVILAGLDGHCLLINDQLQDMLSTASEPASITAVVQRIQLHAESTWEGLLADLVFQGNGFHCEGKSHDEDRDLLIRGRLLELENPLLMLTLTDVSELKSSERKRAEALNFLSHDLRAPLTSVLALIEGAKTEHPNQINRSLLENIESYVRNNLSYAENFTQLAKLESATETRFDECEIHSLIDNAVSQLYHSARLRHITLKTSPCDEDIWVHCNRGLVERALLNMIDNAIKFSPDAAEVDIRAGADDGSAQIAVIDQGAGITAEDMERIFDRYQQGSSATAGVGLGLRFVSAVAKAHGGRILASNNRDQGATFTLEIPRISAQ